MLPRVEAGHRTPLEYVRDNHHSGLNTSAFLPKSLDRDVNTVLGGWLVVENADLCVDYAPKILQYSVCPMTKTTERVKGVFEIVSNQSRITE